MIEYEANRFINYLVPYYRNIDDEVVSPGDTKAEENAWNSMILHLAINMMPDHPNWNAWMDKNLELKVSACSRPADIDSNQPVSGKSLSKWLDGSNYNNDGTAVNHGMIHPDYMLSVALSLDGILSSVLANRSIPEATRFNGDRIYSALVDLEFPSPPNDPPGGTIYVDGSPDLYYPEGTDWSGDRVMNYLQFDVYADVLGLDRDATRPAKHWEKLRTEQALALQERHDDGHMYDPDTNYTYGAREEHVGMYAGKLYLMKWLDHNSDRFKFTNRAYPETKNQSPWSVPAPPAKLRAGDDTSAGVELTWTKPANPQVTVKRYNIYRDKFKIAQTTEPSYVDTDIESQTEYTYRVTAVTPTSHPHVESAKSNPAAVRTGTVNVSDPDDGSEDAPPSRGFRSVMRHNGHIIPLQIYGHLGSKGRAIFWPGESDLCGGGYRSLEFEFSQNYADGQWHHYAVTYESGDKFAIYVDGEEVASMVGIVGTLSQDDSPWGIGAAADAAGVEAFKGGLDEVSIYDRALSQEQIRSVVDGQRVAEDSQVVRYGFEEVGVDSINDLAGSDDSGTVYGDPVWEEGPHGKSITLDGDGDYVSVESNGRLNPVDEITAAFWFRTEEQSA